MNHCLLNKDVLNIKNFPRNIFCNRIGLLINDQINKFDSGLGDL